MKLLHPEFLWLLSLLAVPIIIHLLNLRRFKPIWFPNVLFLEKIQEQSRKQSRLKRWIQLLIRCLVFVLLVLAFCQPFLPASFSNQAGQQLVGIYLDNSFSMQGVNELGNVFDQAKQQALKVVRSYPSSSAFIFSTNTFNSEHYKILNREEIEQHILETEIAGSGIDFTEIYQKQQALAGKQFTQANFFYLSDLQKHQFPVPNTPSDSLYHHLFIPFNFAPTSNVSIDSVWLNRPTLLPNTQQKLYIRLNNRGTNAIKNLPVKVMLNEEAQQQLRVNIAGNEIQELATSITIPNREHAGGKISLEDYPITYDNDYLFALNTQTNIRIHTLYEPGSEAITNIFNSDTLFEHSKSVITAPDLGAVNNAQVVFILGVQQLQAGLINALKEGYDDGATLIIAPPKKANINSYNQLFTKLKLPTWQKEVDISTKINNWVFEHPLLSDVLEKKTKQFNYPTINHYYTSSKTSGLIAGINQTPIIQLLGETNNGVCYRINTSLNEDNGNFRNHALLLTALFRMGETASQEPQILQIIGEESNLTVNKQLDNDRVFHIVNESTNIIPYQIKNGNKTLVQVPRSLQEAGYYQLTNGEEVVQLMALNHTRTESGQAFWEPENYMNELVLAGWNAISLSYEPDQDLQQRIKTLTQKSFLWKYCLWGMLLLLMLELLINKRW